MGSGVGMWLSRTITGWSYFSKHRPTIQGPAELQAKIWQRNGSQPLFGSSPPAQASAATAKDDVQVGNDMHA